MKFDVIVGNPPYNGEVRHERKGQNNNAIWPDFVKKSLSLLNDNGYLVYVHPALWRKPEHELWNILTKKQLLHVDIHSKDEGCKVFGAATRYDWYVLQNSPITHSTEIVSQDRIKYNLMLSDLPFLTSGMVNEVNEILAKSSEEKCEVLYDSKCHTQKTERMSNKKTKVFKYPCVHSLNSKEKGGMICWYSNTTEYGHFGEKKVILTWAEVQRPYNDYKGEYGTTQIAFGIKISSKNEGDLIVAAINTPKFQEIIKYTKWGTFQTEWRFFKYLKKDFWKYFVDENGNVI